MQPFIEVIIVLTYIFIITISYILLDKKYPYNPHIIKDEKCKKEINNAINNTAVGTALAGIGGLISGLFTYLIVTMFTNMSVRYKFGVTILSIVLTTPMIYKIISCWKSRVLY